MPIGRNTVYHGANVKIDFELDRRGIADIAVGFEVAAACRAVVLDRALPHALGLSASFVDPDDKRPPNERYINSFRVENTEDVLGPAMYRMRRAAARLVNISSHAIYVEVGTKNNEAHHVLLKTLEFLAATGGAPPRL